MEIMNNINWRVLEREILSSLNENDVRFRRVWTHYTRLGSVQFTLFPIITHETYRIITRSKFIDVNRNIFAYARTFDTGVTFATPPTDEDRTRAVDIVTSGLTQVFVNEINSELTPAS